MPSPSPRVLPLLLVVVIACAASEVRCSDGRFPHLERLRELHRRGSSPPTEQEAAARGLLERLLPSHSASFEFRIISKEQCGRKACFIINNHPLFDGEGSPEILILGTSGVEISAGFHWYLKHYCAAHISWYKTGGSQLSSIPHSGSLPRVPAGGVSIRRPVDWSYYQNAVTSSYSFAWWDWERWEKEIDWMALQGINLPLAFTGQEAIWQRVFQRYNISKSDLDDFFGGPAFLAWSRMANMHGWGGPLPQTWLDDQLALQKKILSRMSAFGMFPVLPAFSGNIPAALKSKFPSAKVTHLGNWFTVDSNPRWCCTYLLDASDPLFVEIGKLFIEEQIREYGRTSHIYNCDTFDENTPPINDPNYISSLGAATFRGMQSGDNDATWLMQGWLFTYDPFWEPPQMKALLHSVPVGRMIVLDLYAEVKPVWINSDQFYGVPYIWCMLHNFAADFEMYGVLDAVASGPIDAQLSDNSTMVGVGMSMEGIEQNPIVYDLMSEMAFHHRRVDLQVWVETYPTRRYGKSVKGLQDAWWILYQTLYNCTDGKNDKNRDVIVAFPDVEPFVIQTPGSYTSTRKTYSAWSSTNYIVEDASSDVYEQPHLWYDTSVVIHALELFLQYGGEVSDSNTFRYDLVDLTRQVLAKYANDVFVMIIKSYKSNSMNQVTTLCQHFLDLVNDLDTLLASHEGFLLGPWLENAKGLARDREQEIQYEWNARTQITMWFDNTETKASLLRDYANKYWSGLLRGYYGPRAAIYFKHLLLSMDKNEPFALEDWRREWISLTNNWQSDRKLFPTTPTGDALNISRSLYMKYLRSPNLLELEVTGSSGKSASL
ncbi:alpha-N-acetylglucosaminidase-like [Phragmites australis]|uniref:alpha-N-acetylglucosaminidase-like n=1 Tax=Phragmites australis TaxID=29695 RepID=UPI002D78F59A|nr:alpha-N-acetylglucosaminidase-like [Phragmites australis]